MLLFRLPNSTEIYTIENAEKHNISVAFFDFHQKEKFRFQGRKKLASSEDFNKIQRIFSQISPLGNIPQNDTPESYTQKIQKVQSFLTEHQLPKLVLSRRKYIEWQHKTLDIVQSFMQMCNTYPAAFVYVFVQGNTAWQGGFYEVLGKINAHTSIFETMSLAGTLPLQDEWTEKELNEQKAVTEYLSDTLRPFSTQVNKGARQDVLSGNIKHLCTPFHCTISSDDFDTVIRALHPTPAVCGIPKDICQKEIEAQETEPRELYSGYIEISDTQTRTCYVNLRCARLYPNVAKIFVGGGITPKSTPQKEWKETELKAEAIYKSLKFID